MADAAETTQRTPLAGVDTSGLTPAMRQYVEQKRRVGDAVLLFRMGDFYEAFYGDAELCARVLGITLTARNKHDDPIPLAGIPYHALDNYLKKLVSAGYKVAISEQLEDPRQAKGVVRRDVVRIVTAGTLTDEALLDESRDNWLAAVCIRKQAAGVALVELAGGRLEVMDVGADDLIDELARLAPAEMLVEEDDRAGAAELASRLTSICETVTTTRGAHEFSTHAARKVLHEHFGVSSLAGFGFDDMTLSLRAAGAALAYLGETQKTSLGHVVAMRRRESRDYLMIDHHSWRSLEVELTMRGGQREGALFGAMDLTVHPLGRRRLRQWLRRPLIDAGAINRRLDAVAHFTEDEALRDSVRRTLAEMADMERIAARIALRRASPRDLAGLALSAAALPKLSEPLRPAGIALFDELAQRLEGLEEMAELLGRAVDADPPPHTREGGYIAAGFDEELDRLRGLRKDANAWLAAYQVREAERTGIQHLKVGFNRVFGYYIEVSHAARDRVPADYVRRQTLKNAERFITEELKEYENEILSAQDRAVELEQRLFDDLIERISGNIEAVLAAADAVGRVDTLAALAELAVRRRYVRPAFTDDGTLHVEEGRHPVLDQTLDEGFVPNDTAMAPDDGRVFIITGPNMAGKSTYIRQVALLTIMAQTGSFVPARAMRLSIVDRLFARIGASDEIMRGQSTFMVEMTEAAYILRHATKASLVVLDEIGRGTSTFDGLSLAWAITEHLASVTRCRCLVATHYHEMTEMADLLEGVRNCSVAVREQPVAGEQDDVVFLHRIVPGGADKSYGIHVARLAGLPRDVVARSREVLADLEEHFSKEAKGPRLSRRRTRNDDQMTLFEPLGDALLRDLGAVEPEQMTPLDALKKIAEWKERYRP